MTLYLKFKTNDETINSKLFQFDGGMTVKAMLESFLKQTNSKMTLNPDDIAFQYGAIILNKQEQLNKVISSVFTAKKNTPIRVQDVNNVIGG